MTINLVPMPKRVELHNGTHICRKIDVEHVISKDMMPENYKLIVETGGVTIFAGDDAGFFYGEKTLEQLHFLYPDGIPCLTIEDAPLYPYRSFHIDTARHFVKLDVLKKMVEAAASFKLNKFHWHFSDDQGWRIECKRFPKLHEIGARRKGDHFGQWDSDEEEYFYYTRNEVKELVEFCRLRGIEVVPEVDIPGHVTAILAAYPELSCTGQPVEVCTGAGIFYEILCAGKDKTFEFINELVDDLSELFPGRYFHIGGDETPKSRWKECPYCKKRMKQEKLSDERQLQGYMVNRIAEHLKTLGKTAVVWNESAVGGNLNPEIVVQLWNDDPKDPSLKALGGEKDENGKITSPNQGIGAKVIRAGGSVIMSNMMGSYCDYPYAFISTEKVYDAAVIPQKCEDMIELAREHVKGVECLLWTEHIRDEKGLESHAWPRFAAKAEVGWCGTGAYSYRDFAKRMKVLFPYLKRMIPFAAEPKWWKPGPILSVKEMIAFSKNYSKRDRKGYADAQHNV